MKSISGGGWDDTAVYDPQEEINQLKGIIRELVAAGDELCKTCGVLDVRAAQEPAQRLWKLLGKAREAVK